MSETTDIPTNDATGIAARRVDPPVIDLLYYEPEERAYIGMDIMDPAPDFATLARSMGWYAEGPIENPNDIAAALKRAIAQVKAGKPALIDTITQHTG